MSLKSITRTDIQHLADSSAIFRRGEDYLRSGAIYQFKASANNVTAKVRGNYGNYAVKVKDVGDELDWNCTCPYDGDVCKHIVAVLLRYLESDHTEAESLDEEIPDALTQTLKAMPHQQLLDLVLKLAKEEDEFRSLLLAHVSISPQTLSQQPRNPRQVRKLKQQIAGFFGEVEHRSRYDYDYDYEYDENEEYAELDSVFAETQTLNPLDQIEIYWHVVKTGNDMFEEYPVGTAQIEQAIAAYAGAVSQLGLTHEEKCSYFDSLIEALDWDMCGYGSVSEAIKDALDMLCQTPEDCRYLISRFKASDHPEAKDWVAEYYLQLGDEKNYLRTREKNLVTAAQHLELAHYWLQKGDEAKHIATLERFVSKLPEKESSTQSGYSYWIATAESSTLLQTLADYYLRQEDDPNWCRILMATAQYDSLTLELYRQIESVAIKLGTWPQCRPVLIERAKQHAETLAKIYLYEEDWAAAINLAKQLQSWEENVQTLIAESVKETDPQSAIKIYQRLVQHYIDGQNRETYRRAAACAEKLKSIHLLILNDEEGWQQYVNAIRQEYPRRRALQEEFRRL